MPEKELWNRHVGMEALNSVGSAGSCDSMESISSNHSAFSGDSYDYLSAEERECLMFMEEIIDSLDNEVDSGLSNDESDVTEKTPSLPQPEPVTIPPASGDEKQPNKISSQPKTEEKAENHLAENFNKVVVPKQGYHSFPRIIQAPKEETPKHPTDGRLVGPTVDQGKTLYGKPKSLSSINQKDAEESPISELLLLPPPEPFRDIQTVDKRHSVTDPTDAREAQFGKALPISTKAFEYKETPLAVEHPVAKAAPSVLFPRPLLQKSTITGSQETLNHTVDKSTDSHFKQGPPTAPKPRKLPPHIMIKPVGGTASNIEPQQRPRAFSAHERNNDKANEAFNTKIPPSKEQERARREALQKLGLMQEKTNVQKGDSMKPAVVQKSAEVPVNRGIMEHGHRETYGKSININPQEKTDVLGGSPVQNSFLASQRPVNISSRNESVGINRLTMKSNSFQETEELSDGAVTSIPQEAHVTDTGSPRNVKVDISRNRPSVKTSPLEKAGEVVATTYLPSREAHTTTVDSPKMIKSEVIANQPNVKTNSQERADKILAIPAHSAKEAQSGVDSSIKNVNKSLPNVKTNIQEKVDISGPAHHQMMTAAPGLLSVSEKSQENKMKTASLENIGLSTSPGKTFSFPRPMEVSVPHASPEVVLRDGKGKAPNDKTNRHSSHLDSLNEPLLRLPQGSVPGLRQISIKSNTLERSGIGLSSSIATAENQGQKGGNLFFRKPMFSGNFLRNSRPRPASLGTRKDFSGLEEPKAEAEKGEGRLPFFSRNSRTSAPVTSVKITPKGSTDEHRREALKKLGILKE
ncbi:specifically androgen-regulated gene protein [Rhinophrynus dorsalis]